MDLDLAGKRVLITGGSRGIGLACARTFAREGAIPVLVSRSQEHLDDARRLLEADGAAVEAIAADLSSGPAAAGAVSQALAGGSIDVLVNSAGAARRTAPEDLTADHWQAAMAAKFFPYVNTMTALIPHMAARGAGAIVNVIGAGGKVATPIHLPGGSANAALMLASAGLAAAWGPKGIRVNAVNPATTRTTRMEEGLRVEAERTGRSPDAILSTMEARIPLRRVATPEDIADAVVWLSSARAAYVTGAILTMDGGMTPLVV